jgi:glycine betaine catabolism B
MKAIDGQTPQSLTTLLFLTFVFIADAEDSLTSREVERLNKLLADTNWVDDALMHAALVGLGEQYTALWKAYDAGSIKRDRQRLAEELRALSGLDANGGASVRAALRSFAQRIADSGSPVLARLGLGASARARQAALLDFEQLLTIIPEAFAAPAVATETAVASRADAIESTAPARDLSRWPAAELGFLQENIWKRGRTRVRCVRVTPETHDVKTFTFVTDPPRVFSYKPGQYVTLEVPIDGKIVRRSFTISSSPSRPYTLTITVKNAPSGTVTKWLHQNATAGFEMDITGPHGKFSCFHAPAEKLLLIAAGSGITPLMSMLRWLSDTASPADVVFINNVRTPNDVIFERELYLIGSKLADQFRLGIVPAQVQAGQVWNGPTGHFTENLLHYFAADFLEREVYICGPAGYMDTVKGVLDRAGFPAHRFHQESFSTEPTAPTTATPSIVTPPAPAAPPPASAGAAAPPKPMAQAAASPTEFIETAFEVVFSKSGRSISCKPGDFILEIAEEYGMELANSCRAGNCGTCRLTKIEGTVLMDDQTALTEEDIQSGMVVICIGRAHGRVVLDA